MNNPAQYLLQLFEAAERDNGQTFTARDSSAAMAEIERQAAVVEIQSVLDKYEMTGDFVLADALNRLFAAVFMAETQTRDKSRWQKFKEEKAGPFMQAFLGLALPNILSAAQLVLQITQG